MGNLGIDRDESEESEAEESEAEESEAEEASPSASVASGPPVKLSIRTAVQSSLIDQHLDFTASRTRTVRSLQQAISKTMRGRPPLQCIQLKYHGRTLEADETVDDLLADRDEDDKEESDGEESDIGEEEEDLVRLLLTCDIVPPIDAKFGLEFREKIATMSTREIVEAYCVNVAGMVYGQELMTRESEEHERGETRQEEGEDDDEDEEEDAARRPAGSENHSLNIRKKAALVQKQFQSTLSSDTLQLMEVEHARVQQQQGAAETHGEAPAVYGLVPQKSSAELRRGRKGRTLKGGATMNVKRSLQRNLNVVRFLWSLVFHCGQICLHYYDRGQIYHIPNSTTLRSIYNNTLQNWADTTRNSLLFLFFGYFGGRNSFSRTFLLLSSPLCFFIQTRPVKVFLKQLFYTIGEPPGIFLSLLPAPQQAIMSLDYGRVMKGLYGEEVLAQGGREEWLEMERREQEQGDSATGVGMGEDVDVEEEDEDRYDDETEYDSEDEY